MPLLGQLFVSLFGGFFGGLLKDASRKTATLVVATAAIVTAGVTLMGIFNAAVAPLVAQMFSTQYGQFLGLAFPPIAGTCLATIVGCWLGCAAYRLAMQITQTAASA
jgi:hypothetical protein